MAWALAVVANGGTVSAARLALVSTLISSLKASGSWALRDDCGLLVAESATQALISLKQRRLGTVGGGAPAFTADRGYAFNGSSDFINTGFIPFTHCTVATANDLRIEVYARTNVQSDTYLIGAQSLSTRNLYIRPLMADGTLSVALDYNSVGANKVTLSPADSRGLSAAQRVGGGTTSNYDKNGINLASVTPTFGTQLVAFALYLGAINASGTAATFNAGTIGWWSVGGSLSAAQKASDYAAIQAYMTAVGANV